MDVALDSAAVASIPCTTGNVVVVIAVSIALKLGFPASLLHNFDAPISSTLVRTIPALALLAELVVVLRPATITAVPITSSVVVVIVTCFVTFPLRASAFPLNGFRTRVGRWYEGTIHAFTLLAILVIIAWPAAVTPVPIAASYAKRVIQALSCALKSDKQRTAYFNSRKLSKSAHTRSRKKINLLLTVVVVIVAMLITLVFGRTALAFYIVGTFVALGFVRAVEAFTGFTIPVII